MILSTPFALRLAGTETSRYTLYWVLQYMAMYPDVQARVHEEIDNVLGGYCHSDNYILVLQQIQHSDGKAHSCLVARASKFCTGHYFWQPIQRSCENNLTSLGAMLH